MKISIFGYPFSNTHANAEKLSLLFGCPLYTTKEAARIKIWELPGPWVVEGIGDYEPFDKQLYASDMCVFYDPPAFKCAVNAVRSGRGLNAALGALLTDRKGPYSLVLHDTSSDYSKKWIVINNKKQWDDFMKGANKLAGGKSSGKAVEKIEIPPEDVPPEERKISKFDE